MKRLKKEDHDEFARAKKLGFVVLRGNRPDLRNAFWKWCKKHNRPFCELRTNKGGAKVLFRADAYARSADFAQDHFDEIEQLWWTTKPLDHHRFVLGTILLEAEMPAAGEAAVSFSKRVAELLQQ